MNSNLLNAFVLISLLSLLVACGGSSTAPSHDMTPTATPLEVDAAQLATIKDVVCGMSMKNVPISDTAQVRGKVYPFCAKECKAIFKKDVAKYAVN